MATIEPMSLAFSYLLIIALWIGLFFLFAWVFQQLYNKSLPNMNHTYNKIDYWTAVNFYGLLVVFGFLLSRVYIIQQV